MNELETINSKQLPDSISDLASWDKFLSARLPAYRKLIHNVKSWEEASEEEKRILRRAQEEAENLIDVRVRIGELYRDIPDESGRRTDTQPECSIAPRLSQKQQFKQQTGLSDDQAKRYANLAKHPKAVEAAKADARERNDVVSQQDVLNRIITPTASRQAQHKQTIKEAKQRKTEFESSRAKSNVVSIQDIQQDKKDSEIIGSDLFDNLMKVVCTADKITFISRRSDIKVMLAVIDKDQKTMLENGIKRTASMMDEVLNYMEEC